MTRAALALAAALLPAAAPAQTDFVTDPAMCALEPIDRLDRGMSFDGLVFSEIEFRCVLAAPVRPAQGQDWEAIAPGYCEEPGFLVPGTIVLRAFADAPGRLFAWIDGRGEPLEFARCGG